MKKRLDERVLLPGDIAFTTTDATVSRKIRKVTSSEISHSMLCVAHASIVHADGDGVHAENMQRIFFNPNTPVFVKRIKGGLPAADARNICDHVRTIVGTQYSVKEAMKVMAGGSKNLTKKQFCSRLIAQAYHKFGYELVRNPNYCSPQDILQSNLLVDVAPATTMVSEEEYNWYQNSVASPEFTKNATNFILTEVRKLNRNVNSLDDINKFLLKNQMFDHYVEGLFRSSGYLEIWRLDYDGDASWRLDISKMDAIPDEASVRRYCKSTMSGDSRDDNRFTASLTALNQMHRTHPRLTFATLIELYEKLVEFHAIRFDVAKEWLRRHP